MNQIYRRNIAAQLELKTNPSLVIGFANDRDEQFDRNKIISSLAKLCESIDNCHTTSKLGRLFTSACHKVSFMNQKLGYTLGRF